MKKLLSLILITIVSVSIFFGCSSYNINGISDIKNEYVKLVEQYKAETSEYDVFGESLNDTSKTLIINYKNADISNKINASSPSSEIDLRYSALSKINQRLLLYIFRYYEKWSANFYENAEGKLAKSELTNFYEKFLAMKNEINNFINSIDTFENEIILFGVNSPLKLTLTSYTYKYNMLIEKSLDFVKTFRDYHVKYVFTSNSANYNSAQRLIDEYYLNLAEIVYYENVKCFNYENGNSGTCDLLYVMSEFKNNPANKFILFDEIQNPILSLKTSIAQNLANSEYKDGAEQIINNAIYFSNAFSQNLITYGLVYNDLDYFELTQYKFGVVSGSLNSYLSRFNEKENSAYTIISTMLNYVTPSYISGISTLTI